MHRKDSGMELRQIQYFIQLYKDRNITRASKHLYISQQGLSKSINRLEEELGFSLFHRHTSGVIPTEEADSLFPLFCRISSSHQDLLLAIDGIHRYRTLKITAFHGFALSCDRHLFSDYSRTYPQVQLRYQERSLGDIPEALFTHKADLAFLPAPLPEHLISLQSVCREPIHLVMDSRHPLASASGIRISDLHGQSLLLLESMEDFNTRVLTLAHRENVSCHIQGTVDLSELLPLVHVSSSVGIASRQMYRYSSYPEISFVPFDTDAHPELMMETHLTAPADAQPGEEAQQFLNYIREKLQPHT